MARAVWARKLLTRSPTGTTRSGNRVCDIHVGLMRSRWWGCLAGSRRDLLVSASLASRSLLSVHREDRMQPDIGRLNWCTLKMILATYKYDVHPPSVQRSANCQSSGVMSALPRPRKPTLKDFRNRDK